MKIANVNGIDIAYERWGSRTPLLLIHGFPLDRTSWSAVVPLLVTKFDLIIPDLRGFGDSSPINGPYRMTDAADDLAGLLDHLGVDRVAVAGHSMGGYVALAFVEKYLNRVSGLALISSQAAADSPEKKDGRYKTAQAVGDEGIGVVVDAMMPKFSAKTVSQEYVHEIMSRQKPSGMIGGLEAMAEREDRSAILASLGVPLILIHGDADELIPIDKSREIKSVTPSAKLVELAGVGHLPMVDASKETAEALKLLL